MSKSLKRATPSQGPSTSLRGSVLAKVHETPERRAEALTSEILGDLEALNETFWRIGEKLHAILDDRLYAALGFETFAAYVDARLGVALSQARKMVRVVRNYVRTDAEKLGLERATSLVRYAAQVGVDPGTLVREDALVGAKPVSQASVRDIEAATVEVARATRKRLGRAPAQRELQRENRALTQALSALLVDAQLRGAKVALVKDEFVVRIARDKLAKRFGR